MAPRTRQARKAVRHPAGESLDGSQVSLEHATGPNISNDVIGVGQDAMDMDNPQTLAGNTPQPPMKAISIQQSRPTRTPAKKHAQLLTLTSEGEAARQPSSDGAGGSSKGKQRVGQPLQRTSSFYPGCGGTSSMFDVQTNTVQPQTNPVQHSDDEPDSEAEEDWIDEQAEKMTTLPRGQREKAMAIEPPQRPVWSGSTGPSTSASVEVPRAKQGRTVATSQPAGHGTSASAPVLLPVTDSESESVPPTARAPVKVAVPSEAPRLQEHVQTLSPPMQPVLPTAKAPVNIVVPSEAHHLQEDMQIQSPPKWAAETEIRFMPGTNRVILTAQGTLLRTVIQDAFENLRAAILFQHAFPDGALALSYVRDALITAARQCGPAAASIYTRMLNDTEYFTKIIPLPRARISHFRAEVKERCNVIAATAVLGLPTRTQISRYIQDQLSNYNYTFPGRPRGPGQGVLVRRTKPYRNMRIIDAVCNSFFSGGNSSFATRFKYLFPSSETHDLVTVYEVPIPMLALVATALYAALYEWRTGEQQIAEFSTNSYLDVYQGHVNTLELIREKRSGVFRSMMADIYHQASTVTDAANFKLAMAPQSTSTVLYPRFQFDGFHLDMKLSLDYRKITDNY
ncbi:hypothetical protein EDB83DRAFT_2318036 [Lactarius deliciosus]|nr:hypothetical protein EDB83DRAFT_2318036 [Lactarius deliciosus]